MATRVAGAKSVKEFVYEWEGKDRNGKIVRGDTRASGENQVQATLRRQGIFVTKIKKRRMRAGKKIKPKDIAIFTRQLATMMKAGVPLLQSFDIVARGNPNPSVTKLLNDIRADIETGTSLSAAFRKYPLYFNNLYCNLVEAGEAAGILESLLDRLATYMEKTEAIKSKIKSALSYPIFVVCVAIVVLIVVMVVVIPTLTQTFAELGGELPIMTQVLISTSEFFSKYWIFMVIAILALVLAWKMYVKTDNGIMTQGRMQLNMPVLGKIHRMSGAAEFANTMSMLLSSGLNVDRAIDITAKTLNNSILRKETESMIARIEEGHPLGECIRDCKNYPRTLQEMCAMGEETGELDSSLKVIGDFYTNEADTATKDALAKLEPTMLVLLAVFAGFIVISIYLPMFTMYNLM